MQQLRSAPLLSHLWRRIEATPKPQAENSLWLRVLVQALVIVGIVATDVAAETFGTSDSISLWAVPLSIVGAAWSWYHRRDRNIPVKFALAIGMLLSLAYFLWSLRDTLTDTRLTLAQLLIQLQVLHSFDLPRRKDLGYSMVIGLILLGVAATISQTMAFAPLLLLFLAIALPVLMLDYRSRLGLTPWEKGRKKDQFSLPFSFKHLSILLFVIVSLGLLIFAFLPRLPGYQLRTFPVSSPIQFKGDFNSQNVVNPGYRGKENQGKGNGSGGGLNKEEGAGLLDPTFPYIFNDKINQNLRGELIPKVVMRVRSQAEGFWRVVGFDRYTGQGWEMSRDKQILKLDRVSWSYKFFLPTIATANGIQEVVQTYTITSEMPSLIPALSYAKALYFPSEKVAIDPEGGLRGPGLPEGLTYTVISDVPYRDRTLLNKASTKYSRNIQKYYLQIPAGIKEKVQNRTEEILANANKVAKSNKAILSTYEKALYLTQYLKQNPNYKLQKDPPFLAKDEDLVEAFLFGYRNSPTEQKITGGYPDHFATVLAVMLRSIGIPARVVGGFAPGEFNPFTGYYVVRNSDAYLITEVYFPRYGWFAFDPVPGRPLIPPSIEQNQTFSVLQQFWQWVAGWFPSPVRNFFTNVFGAIVAWLLGAIAWFFALFAQGWIGFFTGAIIAIGLGFLLWLGWEQWRIWRYRQWLAKLPPMESLYQQMLNALKSQGYPKHPAQTPLEYARNSHQHHAPNQTQFIDQISQAYVSWRYGNQTPNLNHLRQQLQQLKKQLRIKNRKIPS